MAPHVQRSYKLMFVLKRGLYSNGVCFSLIGRRLYFEPSASAAFKHFLHVGDLRGIEGKHFVEGGSTAKHSLHVVDLRGDEVKLLVEGGGTLKHSPHIADFRGVGEGKLLVEGGGTIK